MTLQLLVILSAVAFWFWIAYRATHPFKCRCGYATWFGPLYVGHLVKPHGPVKS